MFRILALFALAFASAVEAQNIPLLRINPQSLQLYRQAEPLDKAGDLAGVMVVWRPRLEAGDDLAQFETGVVLLRSPATSPEAARGLDLVRKSAASGFVRAQVRLYALYRNGFPPLLEADPAQAIAWLRRAAEQGFPPAMVHLGLAYLNGFGMERSPKEAFALFQRAAERNHPFGHFAVGAAYESGIGVPVDLERAREAYRKAIERATWLDTRPNPAYVFRQFYGKWITDSKAALAGLDSTASLLETEQAKIADERRKVEAENARLVAERRRIAEEAEQRAAAERKQAQDARLAEERRRLEAERTKLAEQRRRLEAENARLAEEDRRRAAERKQAEEVRIAEERRQLEAEQARIAEERRRIEAESARVAVERSRTEQAARVQAPAPTPAATVATAPASPPASQGGENDFAASFGRLVRGLTTGIQVARGVQAAASGARARDEGRFTQGMDQIFAAAGLGPIGGAAPPGGVAQPAGTLGSAPGPASAGALGGIPPGARAPNVAITGVSGTDCEAALDVVKDEFKRVQPGNERNTLVLLESQMRLYADTIALVHRYCPNDPKYTRFLPDLRQRFAQAQTTCNQVATAGCNLNNGRIPR